MGLTELHDLKTFKVSLVDRGANKKKRFPITKSEEDMDYKELTQAVLDTEVDNEKDILDVCKSKEVSEVGTIAAKALMRILSANKDELSPEIVAQVAKSAGFEKQNPFDDEEEDEEKKAAKEKAAKEKEEEEKKAKKAKEENMNKQLESIKKEYEDQLEEVKKELAVERDNRVTREWIAKAEDELKFYPGKTADELGTKLKKFADVDPKLADSEFKDMKAISDKFEKSGMLEEVGVHGRGGDETAQMKAEKIAKSLREKDPKLTEAQAMSEVYKNNPELYAQYENETCRR